MLFEKPQLGVLTTSCACFSGSRPRWSLPPPRRLKVSPLTDAAESLLVSPPRSPPSRLEIVLFSTSPLARHPTRRRLPDSAFYFSFRHAHADMHRDANGEKNGGKKSLRLQSPCPLIQQSGGENALIATHPPPPSSQPRPTPPTPLHSVIG